MAIETDLLAIINPNSGKGRASRKIANFLGADKFKVQTISDRDIEVARKNFRRYIENGSFEHVLAVGGDGLVHLCIQELVNKDTSLIVVPAGTGNDFANSIAGRYGSISNMAQLVTANVKQIDLGKIVSAGEIRWFGQVLSTGFDAVVNAKANKMRYISGQMKYNLATLLVLRKFDPINYTIVIDGVARDLKAMLISVANGPTYGGGMKICPMADPADGYLDVIIIKPVSKMELLRVFPKVFSGAHVGHKSIEFHRAKSIKIIADTICYADGEFISDLPVEVSIAEKSLKVITR